MLGMLVRPSLKHKPVVVRMAKLAKKLLRYLRNNADSIRDYGRRYRAGERISTSFVESAVNQIIDKIATDALVAAGRASAPAGANSRSRWSLVA